LLSIFSGKKCMDILVNKMEENNAIKPLSKPSTKDLKESDPSPEKK
jgi:hypothetical protein